MAHAADARPDLAPRGPADDLIGGGAPSATTGPTELERECAYLRQAQLISRVGSWRYDLQRIRLTASEALLELWGVDRADFEGYADLEAHVHPDDRDPLRRAVRRLMTTGEPMRERFRIVPREGRLSWIVARGVAERGPDGATTIIAGTVADVTELVEVEIEAMRAHAEERQANDFQQAIITATPDAIHIFEVGSGQFTRANRFPRPLVGFTDEEIRVMSGEDLAALVPEDDLPRIYSTVLDAQELADGEIAQLRHRVTQENGAVRWLSRRMTPFARAGDGSVTRVLVVSRDVTDITELEHRLEKAAMHDDLTGLPNRRLMRERLDDALGRIRRGGHLAVLVCDLDGFKRVNDRHGHQVGDDLLRVAATRLTRCCRATDTVARMGGDEFAVLLDIGGTDDPQGFAERVADRILEAFDRPVALRGSEHRVSMSIGIRLTTETRSNADGVHSAENLLGDADAAMYYVKSHGTNGYQVFESSHRPDRRWRDDLERQIRQALDTDRVEVHYQPIINPRTNGIYGVEALVRIPDESGHYLPTPDVINVAENTGLMTALDARVLELACSQGAAWRRRPELAHLALKVNRSVQDITKPGFADRILAALATSSLEPSALTLEITETVLLDATHTNLDDLRRLHQQGIGLAIDDFGTGYASLRYLAELPITCIKIDRSFTSRLPGDRTSATLVRATVGLAEQLDINCIVEGVETVEQLNSLPGYGRLLVQGWIYGAAQPVSRPLQSCYAVTTPQPSAR